jgi:glucosyl-3-phosphoglycerate synthase
MSPQNPAVMPSVKACYRRPFRNGAEIRPTGGGRVTELTARPLVRALYPELAGFAQPIAGELAAERALLMDLPFFCGYAVDLPLLINAWKIVGLDGLAQVDLDVRQNRHRPLAELASLADAVVGGVLTRAQAEGRFNGELSSMRLRERPPMSTYQSLRSFN